MILRDANFYDLVARGLDGVGYQEFVDTVFADKYNVPQTQGFRWDDEIQIDFEYKQLQTELGIYAMATYVDVDSPAPYRSTQGFQLNSGSVPRFKHGFALNEKMIREQMILLDDFNGKMTDRMQSALRRELFNSTDQLIGGNYNTLTYQRHQAVSTGQFSILDTNNPQGIKNVSFDFRVPEKNKKALIGQNRWWTDVPMTTEGTASNPINDLIERVKFSKDNFIPVGHFEVDKTLWDAFIAHSKVLTAIGYLYSPLVTTDAQALQVGSNLTEDELKSRIEKKIQMPITVIDSISAVERYSKTERKVNKEPIRSFDGSNFVLVPDGELGTIKAVRPIVVDDPAARTAFYDGGRTVLMQTFDAKRKIQYIESELTALTVPNKAQYMIYLTVK